MMTVMRIASIMITTMSALMTPPTSAPVLVGIFRGGVLDEEVAAEVKEEEDVPEVSVVGSGNHVRV